LALALPKELRHLSCATFPGEIKGDGGEKITAGKLGEYTVGANKTVVLGDPVQVRQGQHRPVQVLSWPTLMEVSP
jgi:hypothetical protein